MIRTIGITGILVLKSLNPSIAEVTVIEGVITPSASKAAPPAIVRSAAQLDFFLISAKRAKIPPSPLLSARRVIMTYLIVVCRVSVQNIHDNDPYINSSLILAFPARIIALIVYKGLVPRSP